MNNENTKMYKKWDPIYEKLVERYVDYNPDVTKDELINYQIQTYEACFWPIWKYGYEVEDNEDLEQEVWHFWEMNWQDIRGEYQPEEQMNEENDWYQDVLFVEKFGRR